MADQFGFGALLLGTALALESLHNKLITVGLSSP